MDTATMLQRLGLDEADGLPSGHEELMFNCLWCQERGEPTPDTKHKLYVNVGTKFGTYHCFRCGKSGHVHETSTEERQRFFSEPVRFTDHQVLHEFYRPKKVAAKPEPELPSGFYPIAPGMRAWDYLLERGLTPAEIEFYDIGIAQNRIIFPDYLDGKLAFWVGRAYDESRPAHQKYFNVPGVPRTDKLYNLGRFLKDGHRQVIITEGPISAIMAGRDAIATYGKQITPQQLQMLQALPVERYYVALDPDVSKEHAIAVARTLSQTRRAVALINLPPRMDPADLGRERFRRLLPRAAVYDMFNRTTVLNFLQPFSDWDVLEQEHA